jgi:hypothetical protein
MAKVIAVSDSAPSVEAVEIRADQNFGEPQLNPGFHPDHLMPRLGGSLLVTAKKVASTISVTIKRNCSSGSLGPLGRIPLRRDCRAFSWGRLRVAEEAPHSGQEDRMRVAGDAAGLQPAT